jgi:hypothetical protein
MSNIPELFFYHQTGATTEMTGTWGLCSAADAFMSTQSAGGMR